MDIVGSSDLAVCQMPKGMKSVSPAPTVKVMGVAFR